MPFSKCNSLNEVTTDFALSEVVDQLRQARLDWRKKENRLQEKSGRQLPSSQVISQAMQSLVGALFPMRLGPDELENQSEDFFVGYTLNKSLSLLMSQVQLDLMQQSHSKKTIPSNEICQKSHDIVFTVAKELPKIRRLLDQDVDAAYRGDPAATSVDEVLLCYPGLFAMVYHRIAHEFYKLKVPMIARVISELSHSQTGIDIHPGATIGAGCFIDHGTGVVIGETAILGTGVRIYQHVTLGAKSFPSDEHGNLHKGLPRHPIVENNVVIYAGATILGRITIGHDSVIGGNVWMTKGCEPYSSITQANPCSGDIKQKTIKK